MQHKDTLSKIKEQEKSKLINSNDKLEKLISDYLIQKLVDNINKRKSLEIILYNKSIQKRIDININHYKEYSEKFSSIEIEIIPRKDKYGKFINIDKKDELYYHIYFNDNKKEIKYKHDIEEKDKIIKIKIIIDYQVKSFKELFYDCECI